VEDGQPTAGVLLDPGIQLEDGVFENDDEVPVGDVVFDRPGGEDPVALHRGDAGQEGTG